MRRVNFIAMSREFWLIFSTHPTKLIWLCLQDTTGESTRRISGILFLFREGNRFDSVGFRWMLMRWPTCQCLRISNKGRGDGSSRQRLFRSSPRNATSLEESFILLLGVTSVLCRNSFNGRCHVHIALLASDCGEDHARCISVFATGTESAAIIT